MFLFPLIVCVSHSLQCILFYFFVYVDHFLHALTESNQFKLNLFFWKLYFYATTGNVFVIAAIILERNLQNVANYLVASLAVADLFVACLVMPLGAVYEVRSYCNILRFFAWNRFGFCSLFNTGSQNIMVKEFYRTFELIVSISLLINFRLKFWKINCGQSPIEHIY